MSFSGHVDDFARRVEADVPNPDELLHANEAVTDLSKKLVTGERPAPIHLQNVLRGKVKKVDKETYRATVDGGTVEGLIDGVRYGRTHPKVDEEYPLFMPTTGTEPWIEVPEQQSGNWLYWMTRHNSSGGEFIWSVVRAPWPPVDEFPGIQVVIDDVATNLSLAGVDGDGGVWLVEPERFPFQSDIPRKLWRYKNYGFDEDPDLYSIPGKWHLCRVDNSPHSHSDPTKGSSSILAMKKVERDEFEAYFDIDRLTTPPRPSSVPDISNPETYNIREGNPGIPVPGGPYGGFGGWLVMRTHAFYWPPSHPEVPFYPPHEHGADVIVPFFGLRHGIPGGHPAELECCQSPLIRGGISAGFWMPDHSHGPAADFPGIQPNNVANWVDYVTLENNAGNIDTWRQWEEMGPHTHWQLFDAGGAPLPPDAPNGGIIPPDAPPDDPNSLGGLDPNAGRIPQRMAWQEYHFFTRDKETDDDWAEVYTYDNKETLIPKEQSEISVQGHSPAYVMPGPDISEEGGVIPPGYSGVWPSRVLPPTMNPGDLATLYRCGGSCATGPGLHGNDGPAPADLPSGVNWSEPDNHAEPLIQATRYKLIHFRGKEREEIDRHRMWTDEHGTRKYAIVELKYNTPDLVFGRIYFSRISGWHQEFLGSSQDNSSRLAFPALNLQAAIQDLQPLVVFAAGPDLAHDSAVSSIASFSAAIGHVYKAENVVASWEVFDDFPFEDFIDQTWDMKHMLATSAADESYQYTIDRGEHWQVVAWHNPQALPFNDEFAAVNSINPRFAPAFIVIMPGSEAS